MCCFPHARNVYNSVAVRHYAAAADFTVKLGSLAESLTEADVG